MSSHRARAEALIDLSAIEYNIKRLLSGTKAEGLAVVKADAYGHGLVPVAKRALSAGAKWLGTALLEEAVALRDSSIDAPIIAWLTPVSDDFESAIRKRIDLAIPSIEHLHAVMKSSEALGISPRIHLEVDTGMSRGGALKEWNSLLTETAKFANIGKLEVIGIWSHFARADEPGHSFNEEQRENFNLRVTEARELGIVPKLLHLSNSAATMSHSAAHFDLVR